MSSNTVLGKPNKKCPFLNGRAIKAVTPRPSSFIAVRKKRGGGEFLGVLWPQVSPLDDWKEGRRGHLIGAHCTVTPCDNEDIIKAVLATGHN